MSSEFLKSVATPEWWVSVALVGVLLNLVSRYLGKALDATVGRLSRSLTQASQVAREKRAAEIEQLRGDSELRLVLSQEEVRSRLRAVTLMLASVLFLILTFGADTDELPRWVVLSGSVYSLVLWTLGLSLFRHAGNCGAKLVEAQRPSGKS